MTDLDIIERVERLFPSPGGIHSRKRHPNHREQYEWRISQRDQVARFLRMILPMLGERRRLQAEKVLALAEDPNGGLGSGHRRKTHCRNGHEYTPENTRVDVKGHRTCRTCRCEEMRRRRAAQRGA